MKRIEGHPPQKAGEARPPPLPPFRPIPMKQSKLHQKQPVSPFETKNLRVHELPIHQAAFTPSAYPAAASRRGSAAQIRRYTLPAVPSPAPDRRTSQSSRRGGVSS